MNPRSHSRGSAALLFLLLWAGVPGAWAADAGVTAEEPASAPASAPASRPARELPAWAPRLSATVKPAVAVIGDPVEMALRVRHRKGVSVNLPLTLELGKFSELSRKESTREVKGAGGFPEVEQTFVLKVAAYELGELTLPPVEITALGPAGELLTLKTEPLPIEIRGVLRNEPNPKPKDIEPPVQVFQRTWWLVYTLIALAAAGLVVAATLIVSRHLRARRTRLRPPPPPVPPDQIALRRLAEIDVDAYIAEERYKELYLLLSEIVRQYVGQRFGFDALERTTSEIAEALVRARVDSQTRSRILEVFGGWDLVKFAKYRPGAEAAREAVQQSEAMVRDTAPPRPAPARPEPRTEQDGAP